MTLVSYAINAQIRHPKSSSRGISCFSVSFWPSDDHAQSKYFGTLHTLLCVFGIGEKKHRASAWTLRWKILE